jgi:MFS transporter, MHS family, proline/betaine transporter
MKIYDLAAVSIGNIIEWSDFGLFIYFAPMIGEVYFPMANPASSTIAAFTVFLTGYICRPLGGMIFGYFGDTLGRVKSLRSSIFMMSMATFIISILPGENTIGVAAPIIFILMRILQGISAGGEYCGVMIYLSESAPFFKRGLITSFAGISANLGFLLATLTIILIGNIFPVHSLNEWVWRIPFCVLGLIGMLIFIFRLRLTETQAYQYLRSYQQVDQKPLLVAIRYAPKELLKIFLLTCISSTFYILFFGYMPNYISQFSGIAILTAFNIQSCLLLAMLFLLPCGGLLGDYIGRKNMLIITCTSMILLAYPFFYFLNTHNISLVLLTLSAATILSAFDQGNNLAAFVENCPIDVRYSGLGFAYNLGNAIFGGTTPLIISLIATNINPIAPAYYIMACGCISLLAILTLLPKNAIETMGFFSQSRVLTENRHL